MNGKVKCSLLSLYNGNHSGWFQGSRSPRSLQPSPHTCKYLFLPVEDQEA